MKSIEALLHLSRLALTDTERSACQADLDEMLILMQHVSSADLGATSPLRSPLDETMLAAADTAELSGIAEVERLQSLSRATREEFYIVPRVI